MLYLSAFFVVAKPIFLDVTLPSQLVVFNQLFLTFHLLFFTDFLPFFPHRIENSFFLLIRFALAKLLPVAF